jgi:hypothetical protein
VVVVEPVELVVVVELVVDELEAEVEVEVEAGVEVDVDVEGVELEGVELEGVELVEPALEDELLLDDDVVGVEFVLANDTHPAGDAIPDTIGPSTGRRRLDTGVPGGTFTLNR